MASLSDAGCTNIISANSFCNRLTWQCRSQDCLPLTPTRISCQRSKGQGATYRVKVHGAEVIEGKCVTCPECGGEGKIRTGISTPMSASEPLHRH
jgi:DnaJ-class molecular chaperone